MLTRSKEVLDILPSVINAENFDFVIHGGDIVCGGSSFNIPNNIYTRSLKEAAATFDQINTPFFRFPEIMTAIQILGLMMSMVNISTCIHPLL